MVGLEEEVRPDLRACQWRMGTLVSWSDHWEPRKDAEQESKGIDLPTWHMALGTEWRRHICGKRGGRETSGGL